MGPQTSGQPFRAGQVVLNPALERSVSQPLSVGLCRNPHLAVSLAGQPSLDDLASSLLKYRPHVLSFPLLLTGLLYTRAPCRMYENWDAPQSLHNCADRLNLSLGAHKQQFARCGPQRAASARQGKKGLEPDPPDYAITAPGRLEDFLDYVSVLPIGVSTPELQGFALRVKTCSDKPASAGVALYVEVARCGSHVKSFLSLTDYIILQPALFVKHYSMFIISTQVSGYNIWYLNVYLKTIFISSVREW